MPDDDHVSTGLEQFTISAAGTSCAIDQEPQRRPCDSHGFLPRYLWPVEVILVLGEVLILLDNETGMHSCLETRIPASERTSQKLKLAVRKIVEES